MKDIGHKLGLLVAAELNS